MNLIFGMKVIYLMRLDSLVKIVVERCTRNTTKVPTVWNINYQIIKNNNTTTQKKASGCFSPMLFLLELSEKHTYQHHSHQNLRSTNSQAVQHGFGAFFDDIGEFDAHADCGKGGDFELGADGF